jgi:hypothetical protein
MKLIKFLLFCLFTTLSLNAQVIPQDTTKMGYELEDDESILNDTIQLPEVLIYKGKWIPMQEQFCYKVVYKTYPYAKLASERLTI